MSFRTSFSHSTPSSHRSFALRYPCLHLTFPWSDTVDSFHTHQPLSYARRGRSSLSTLDRTEHKKDTRDGSFNCPRSFHMATSSKLMTAHKVRNMVRSCTKLSMLRLHGSSMLNGHNTNFIIRCKHEIRSMLENDRDFAISPTFFPSRGGLFFVEALAFRSQSAQLPGRFGSGLGDSGRDESMWYPMTMGHSGKCRLCHTQPCPSFRFLGHACERPKFWVR